MIFDLARKQRNYNYLELIKSYNSLLKVNGTSNPLKTKDLYNFTYDILGDSTVETISYALSPSDEDDNTLDLLYKTNDEIYLSKENAIFPIATKEEITIISEMLENGDFDLEIDNETKGIVADNIATYFENIKLKKPNIYSLIELKGSSKCADDLKQIKSIYKTFKKAISLEKLVKIKYFYNDHFSNIIIQPIEFIFSQLDQRMRVRAFVKSGKLKTFYLSNIKGFEMINENPFGPYNIEDYDKKELVISCINESNVTERIAARFSDYTKVIKYNKNKNILTYHIFYPDYPTENNRIIFRLRSFGNRIKILSSEKRAIKSEALKALELYEKKKEQG